MNNETNLNPLPMTWTHRSDVEESEFSVWWKSEEAQSYIGPRGFEDSRAYNIAKAAFLHGKKAGQDQKEPATRI